MAQVLSADWAEKKIMDAAELGLPLAVRSSTPETVQNLLRASENSQFRNQVLRALPKSKLPSPEKLAIEAFFHVDADQKVIREVLRELRVNVRQATHL